VGVKWKVFPTADPNLFSGSYSLFSDRFCPPPFHPVLCEHSPKDVSPGARLPNSAKSQPKQSFLSSSPSLGVGPSFSFSPLYTLGATVLYYIPRLYSTLLRNTSIFLLSDNSSLFASDLSFHLSFQFLVLSPLCSPNEIFFFFSPVSPRMDPPPILEEIDFFPDHNLLSRDSFPAFPQQFFPYSLAAPSPLHYNSSFPRVGKGGGPLL